MCRHYREGQWFGNKELFEPRYVVPDAVKHEVAHLLHWTRLKRCSRRDSKMSTVDFLPRQKDLVLQKEVQEDMKSRSPSPHRYGSAGNMESRRSKIELQASMNEANAYGDAG